MGNSIRLRCKKCSYTFEGALGVGMRYPSVCEETAEEILKGSYGDAHRSFLEEHQDAVTDCENVLAVCSNCGRPECVKDLTIYLPVAADPFTLKYISPHELANEYKPALSYEHKCPDCGSSMRIFRDNEDLSGLKCPCCGDELERDEEQRILWD